MASIPTPIPEPIPIPDSFVIPYTNLDLPSFKPPEWVPVPIYREDVPAIQEAEEIKESEKLEEEQEKPVEANPYKEIDSYLRNPVDTSFIQDQEDLEIEEAQTTTQIVEVPFTDIEIPVPKQEIMITAVTTAGIAATASVGATLAAKQVFDQVVKIANPIIKTILKKLATALGKKAPLTWSRQRLVSRPRTKGRRGSKGAI